MGRPSTYTLETANRICESIATGLSLRKTLLLDGMPNMSTVWDWLAAHPEFSAQYARAKEAQAEALADAINDIADDGENDTYVDDEGNQRTDHDVIARSKLRVDARKWIASKILPKKYGDKQQIEHSGNLTLAQLVLGETKPPDPT